VSRTAAFVAIVLYLLVPGAAGTFLSGVPLGLWGLAAFTLVIFVGVFFRGQASSVNWTRMAVCFAFLVAMKAGAAWASMPTGWRGWYYASGDFSGPVRRSTEFVHLDATRIDPAIDFRDDYFPAYFLNEADFNRGIRREVTEPVTARWVGYLHPASSGAVTIELAARGSASISRNGEVLLRASTQTGPVSRTTPLEPGEHALTVEYVKPANTDPLISLRGVNAAGPSADLVVTPEPVRPWRRSIFRPVTIVARLIEVLFIGLFASILGRLIRARRWRVDVPSTLAAAMFVFFVVQGAIAAAPLQHRALSLSGGDDWLGFEARGREILTGGLLMRFGQPLGSGDAYYYYPGYSYVLAAVHALGGEDLVAPIFVHFLLLFLTNLVVYRAATRLFDRTVALGAVALLVIVEQVAFVRHYTTTILSENVYILTVALSVYALIIFVLKGRTASLVWSGLMAGLSALIRPAMMLDFPLAMFVVAAVSWRSGWRRTAAYVTVFVVAWMSVVSLATVRNYLVSGSPILISTTPAQSFVLYNLPASGGGEYMEAYKNHTGLASALQLLGRIAVEHPGDTARNVITKVGFSLGWLQWMGGNLHPEFLLASAGYLLAVLLLPAARSAPTWPVHAFVLAHLAGLVLTMPSNYGYRLLLPMYVFFPMFASAATVAVVRRALPSSTGHGAFAGTARRA
jgi:dolichyl-phosphate-mannose-protein mannosyltransferase